MFKSVEDRMWTLVLFSEAPQMLQAELATIIISVFYCAKHAIEDPIEMCSPYSGSILFSINPLWICPHQCDAFTNFRGDFGTGVLGLRTRGLAL